MHSCIWLLKTLQKNKTLGWDVALHQMMIIIIIIPNAKTYDGVVRDHFGIHLSDIAKIDVEYVVNIDLLTVTLSL